MHSYSRAKTADRARSLPATLRSSDRIAERALSLSLIPGITKHDTKQIAPIHSPSLAKVRQMFSRRINVLWYRRPGGHLRAFREKHFPSSVLNVKPVHTPEMAKAACPEIWSIIPWILDLTLQKHNDGIELLKIKPNFPFCVVVSGAQSMDDATAAIKAGVYSAHDKKNIFTTNPHPFIAEVCALSTASFLLKGRRPTRLTCINFCCAVLFRPREWSALYCLNERTLRNICEEDSNLSPKQFLNLIIRWTRFLCPIAWCNPWTGMKKPVKPFSIVLNSTTNAPIMSSVTAKPFMDLYFSMILTGLLTHKWISICTQELSTINVDNSATDTKQPLNHFQRSQYAV